MSSNDARPSPDPRHATGRRCAGKRAAGGPRNRWLGAVGAGVAALIDWGSARASERASPPPDSGTTASAWHVDLTSSTTGLYNFDNRDDRRADVASRANDGFGMLYQRLTSQASRGPIRLQLRLDAVGYAGRPQAEEIALELAREEPETTDLAALYSDKLREADTELATRFRDTLYPAKYALEYADRSLLLVAGDFYAQLGRGFVLSVRKVDELGSDTTIRGLRATGRVRSGGLSVRWTSLGGVLNPLRVDEISGRRLDANASVRRGLSSVTELGMPQGDSPDSRPCQSTPTCSLSPDQVVAAGVELELGGVITGTQASWLVRRDANDSRPGFDALSPDVSRGSETILTASQFVDLPNLGRTGSAYFEAAHQRLEARDERGPLPPGHALYASASLSGRPLSLQVEAKHYRRFFPLSANVSLSRAREFSGLQYNSVPTTTPTWLDTEFEAFNTCVTGARLQADVTLARRRSVFAWLGRYRSWAERVSNERCDTAAENANDVWHAAVGLDLAAPDHESHAAASMGARFDDARSALTDLGACTDAEQGQRVASCARGLTHVFYRELYLRYDVVHHLAGPLSMQLSGWHRRRRQTQGGPPDPWLEGQHSTSLAWGSAASLALGVEYDQKPGTPSSYLNGQATWRPTPDSELTLSGGQRRAMLRCVSGVCRVVPAFEGARLDATVRF